MTPPLTYQPGYAASFISNATSANFLNTIYDFVVDTDGNIVFGIYTFPVNFLIAKFYPNFTNIWVNYQNNGNYS